MALTKLLVLPVAYGASLMAIDYGTEFFKVGVVPPGQPIEVATNIHSKRKSETAVSFYEPIRKFGTDAVPHHVRGRDDVYFFHNRLLGLSSREVDNACALDKNYYSPKFLVNDTRESIMYGTKGGMSAEEVHGHIFHFAKKIAESANDNRPITDAIICVPSDSGQRVLQSYVDAAEIAGLTKTQLIRSCVAAAIQLGLDYTGSTNVTQNFLFYNMGARLTEVCIVEFSARATGLVAGRTAPSLVVRSSAVDDQLGGHTMDMIIADKMLAVFKEKHAKIAGGVDSDMRSRRKLLAQASKAKHTLSANKQAHFVIPSFREDTDFHTTIQRDDFEEAIQVPIINRLTKVVEIALARANMTKTDIDQVELVGGAFRVPKILDEITAYFKNPEKPKLEIGQHLNGEEAMVMGAALFGANSSSLFRVKRIFLQDVAHHNYSVDILNVAGEEIRNRTVLATAFDTKLNFKKKLYLSNHTESFVLKLYENENLLTTYNLDVASVVAKENVQLSENLTQKVSFFVRADESGIIQLTKPELITELVYEAQVVDEEDKKSKVEAKVTSMYDEWVEMEEKLRVLNMTEDEKIADEKKKADEAAAEKELADIELEEMKERMDKVLKKDKAKDGSKENKTEESAENKTEEAEAKTEETETKTEEKKEETPEEKKDDKKDDAEEKKRKRERRKRKEKLTKDRDLKKTLDKLKMDKKKRELEVIAKESVELVYKTVKKKKNDKYKVPVETIFTMPLPADKAEIVASSERLQAMEKFDADASLRDEKRNSLESLVYSSRDKMDDTAFKKVMSANELKKLAETCTETQEWLDGDGMNADLATYTQRLADMESQMEKGTMRAQELEKRSELISQVSDDLKKVKEDQVACEAMPWLNATKVELAKAKLAEFTTFWEEVNTKQKSLNDHDDPAYRAADVTEKLSTVVKVWSKLKKTKKPKDPKKAATAEPAVKVVKLDLAGKSLEELEKLKAESTEKKNAAVLSEDFDAAYQAKAEVEQLDEAIRDFSGESKPKEGTADGSAEEKPAEEKPEEEKREEL